MLFRFVTTAGSVSPLVASTLCCERLLATQFVSSCAEEHLSNVWQAVACLTVLDALATLVRMT